MAELLTIGYGGKKPDNFFAELEALNPGIVVDVREDPFHAFLGVYTKRGLETRLGARYVWIRELGNSTRELPPTLVDEAEGLRKLRTIMSQHERVVLLCAEKDEDRCHRGHIKAKLLGEAVHK
ncbi:MAG: DUF488 domain-containing protein [Candidatus Bathyarchaeota archaeon]|nr:DUF488 domain-containing protein [Candidatus Bathyarchaeota archaeon]